MLNDYYIYFNYNLADIYEQASQDNIQNEWDGSYQFRRLI
jgi:hypothetical protein